MKKYPRHHKDIWQKKDYTNLINLWYEDNNLEQISNKLGRTKGATIMKISEIKKWWNSGDIILKKHRLLLFPYDLMKIILDFYCKTSYSRKDIKHLTNKDLDNTLSIKVLRPKIQQEVFFIHHNSVSDKLFKEYLLFLEIEHPKNKEDPIYKCIKDVYKSNLIFIAVSKFERWGIYFTGCINVSQITDEYILIKLNNVYDIVNIEKKIYEYLKDYCVGRYTRQYYINSQNKKNEYVKFINSIV